jgi:hypothetical protein
MIDEVPRAKEKAPSNFCKFCCFSTKDASPASGKDKGKAGTGSTVELFRSDKDTHGTSGMRLKNTAVNRTTKKVC